MYDYFYGQWSTYTNYEGVSAIISDNEYHFSIANGTIYKLTTGSYLDNGDQYAMKIRTGWIKPGQELQNFARFRRMNYIGNYLSPHDLKVSVYHDYENQAYMDRTFGWILTGSDGYGTPGYGSGSYGGDDPIYRGRMSFGRQKGSAISLQFEDVVNTFDSGSVEPLGKSFELTEVVLELMLEKGSKRLPNKGS